MSASLIGVAGARVSRFQHGVAAVVLGTAAATAWLRLATLHAAVPATGDHGHHLAAAAFPDPAAFMAMWLAMLVAMMLPTIEPMVATFIALTKTLPLRVRVTRIVAFVAPYLLLWGLAGSLAYAGRVAAEGRPLVVALLVAVAGVYQLSAVKDLCLRLCRTPLSFLLHRPQSTRDAGGAFTAGLRHAAVCFGCCAGLMVGLTAAGAVDLVWMAALGLLMLLEKTHPDGRHLARLSGIGLLFAAPFVPLAPATLAAAMGPVLLGATGVLGLFAIWSRLRARPARVRRREHQQLPDAQTAPAPLA